MPLSRKKWVVSKFVKYFKIRWFCVEKVKIEALKGKIFNFIANNEYYKAFPSACDRNIEQNFEKKLKIWFWGVSKIRHLTIYLISIYKDLYSFNNTCNRHHWMKVISLTRIRNCVIFLYRDIPYERGWLFSVNQCFDLYFITEFECKLKVKLSSTGLGLAWQTQQTNLIFYL